MMSSLVSGDSMSDYCYSFPLLNRVIAQAECMDRMMAAIGVVLGIPFGMGICRVLVTLYDNELYRLPYHMEPRTYAYSVACTILFVSLANLAVREKIMNLDMVDVLKQRE